MKTRLPIRSNRSGSTLIVVIGLLGLLMLIGFTFFTFAAQENQSAENFALAASATSDPLIDPNLLWDFGLKQLVQGPDPTTQQKSALYGGSGTVGRHSMLANLIGTDAHPYNGEGIHIGIDPTVPGKFFVDQNYNGIDDSTETTGLPNLLNPNYSAAATTTGVAPTVPINPLPDVDYTYPDINNLFLAYIGDSIDSNGNPITANGVPVKVIIPSFHRPQYLRDPNNGWKPYANWYNNAATAQKVFRPHPSHVLNTNTAASPSTVSRFLSTALGEVQPFPFALDYDNDGTSGEQGVWSAGTLTTADYEYDVDNDGDGTREGVWLDLDYPIQELANGQRYVPLFSFTVVDADALLNINAVGNLSGATVYNSSGAGQTTGTYNMNVFSNNSGSVSKSNLGLTPSEINPYYAFNTDPSNTTDISTSDQWAALKQYRAFFSLTGNATLTRSDLANMDLLFLLWGRGEFVDDSAGTYTPPGGWGKFKKGALKAGRWGEAGTGAALDTGITTIMAGNLYNTTPSYTSTQFPLPGSRNVDDNNDMNEGSRNPTTGTLLYPPFVQPLDYAGGGASTIRGQVASASSATTFITTLPALTTNYYRGLPVVFLTGNLRGKGGTIQSYNATTKQIVLQAGPNLSGTPQAADWFAVLGPSLSGFASSTNPSRWLEYLGYQGIVSATGDSVLSYFQMTSDGVRMPLYTTSALFDDPSEMILEPGSLSTNDSIFASSEMAGLHLSDADFTTLGASSRLRDLALANFRYSSRAAEIRKRFTTDSWDRKNFGHPFASFRRPWEFNRGATDANNDGLPDAIAGDAYGFRSPGKFPPAFVSTAGTSQYEPFRPELRSLLELDTSNTTPGVTQLKLNLNQLLTNTMLTTGSGNSLDYRKLTLHPDDPGSAPISSAVPYNYATTPTQRNTSAPAYPPTTAAAYEYWARVDRQQMARDIYVLLYTLGGGDDTKKYASGGFTSTGADDDNSTRGLYTDDQLDEMAHFAVNFVDALDRDNVITQFEYDRNLGDGWGLDDNPYTADTANAALGANDRGVVRGIEAQQLTFSEVLAILCNRVSDGDHTGATTYDDGANNTPNERIYTFIELRNASPFGVSLANFAWRIRRVNAGTLNRELRLGPGASGTTIAGGNQFTIGSRSGSDKFDSNGDGTIDASDSERPSDFRVNYDFDVDVGMTATFETIVPASAAGQTATALSEPSANYQGCNLDLVKQDAPIATNQAFKLYDAGGGVSLNVGEFLSQGTAGTGIELVLERRAHLTRSSPTFSAGIPDSTQELDNPWIEVDRINVSNAIQKFDLGTKSATTSVVQTELQNMKSTERKEPFLLNTNDESTNTNTSGTPLRANSIGSSKNSISPSEFTRWQPHFDRDFSSAIELFSIPLYGTKLDSSTGNYVTDLATNKKLADSQDMQNNYNTSIPGRELIAAKKFLRPDYIENGNPTSAASTNVQYDNRWYRLLEFVEVPTRMHQSLSTSQAVVRRVPGKINLNTMRYEEVLAGLVDDGHIAQANAFLQDTFETNRYWWKQFLGSRDCVYDPTLQLSASTPYSPDPISNMYLPGAAGTRPFRSLSSLGSNITTGTSGSNAAISSGGLPDTLLRMLPNDIEATIGQANAAAQLADARQMFEARTTGDRASQSGGNAVDYHTRHRILSKMIGNTTTRSNTFIVWVSVGFFEAVEVSTAGGPQARIGGPLGVEGHRGFFVIDRSDIESAYKYDTATGTMKFDFDTFRANIGTSVPVTSTTSQNKMTNGVPVWKTLQ